ncbi:MAG: DNA/RNA non-specific endonuclease [Saprospiraceae bacterium]
MSVKHLLATLFCVVLLSACNEEDGQQVTPEPDRIQSNLVLGNPSGATTDRTNEENYLIQLPQYSLSYSRSRGIPNWVSWHLSEDWLGNAPRSDAFQPYTALPAGWYQVQADDYQFVANGFDRGHNCPSADRTLTVDDNAATFYMINMIPQAPQHNQGIWEELESYCRKLVREGNELYIISGNYGVGGTSVKGYREKLANGKVTVPRHLWKVIVVLPYGDQDISRIDEDTRVIAVNMQNKDSLGEDNWADYRVSVNEIEKETGYDLLSELSNTIESVIEARVDNVRIP